MKSRNLQRFAGHALLLLISVVFLGCASTKKREWNERVGHYSFDQAVQEMGPPVSSATLDDGGMIAEWFLKPGPQLSFALSSGFEGSHSAVSAGQGVAIPTKGHFLCLEFNRDHILHNWSEVRH